MTDSSGKGGELVVAFSAREGTRVASSLDGEYSVQTYGSIDSRTF